MEGFDRLESSADILGGKARVKNQRITVETIVGQAGAGYTIEQILEDYPTLQREDVLQALRFAARLARQPIVQIAA